MFPAKLSRVFSASKRVLTLYTHRLPYVIGRRDINTMTEFPTTLKGFGYAFNDAGQMRQIDPKDESITDKPFKFEVSNDARHNQAHYEALGEVITEHVYQMLEDAGLHKIFVPSPESPTSSFVFGTKPNFKDTKKLLFLIHGSGVVRAGQWSRSLIINHSTDHGTQLPYIKRAIELGYDVLVTNTNHNYYIEDKERVWLNGSSSPEEHIVTVWQQLIEPVYDTIESFAVVAHSYGGVVTVKMARNYPQAFLNKAFAIAFTDSVHYAGDLTKDLLKWFRKNARNYVTSSKPLGTDLKYGNGDIPSFSAGHTKHEWTSWACMEALFPFLEEKYEERFGSEDQIKKMKLTNDEEAVSEGKNVEDGDGKNTGEDKETENPAETDEAKTEQAEETVDGLEKHEVEKSEKREDL